MRRDTFPSPRLPFFSRRPRLGGGWAARLPGPRFLDACVGIRYARFPIGGLCITPKDCGANCNTPFKPARALFGAWPIRRNVCHVGAVDESASLQYFRSIAPCRYTLPISQSTLISSRMPPNFPPHWVRTPELVAGIKNTFKPPVRCGLRPLFQANCPLCFPTGGWISLFTAQTGLSASCPSTTLGFG